MDCDCGHVKMNERHAGNEDSSIVFNVFPAHLSSPSPPPTRFPPRPASCELFRGIVLHFIACCGELKRKRKRITHGAEVYGSAAQEGETRSNKIYKITGFLLFFSALPKSSEVERGGHTTQQQHARGNALLG